jgi:thymidine kinase
MIGWSEMIFGSMYCGKSEELIRRLKRVKIAGQKYQLFKPALDNRYDLNHVATHENHEIKTNMERILDLHIPADAGDKKSLMKELTKQLSGAMQATVVPSAKDILNLVEGDTSVVGIDEVQFFDSEIIPVVSELTKRGKRVIMAGLDLYASGEPFGSIHVLAAKAKYVDKLHAVCVDCGEDAYISYKVTNEEGNKESQVDVGSTGKYIALCENCAHKRENKN